MDTLVANTSVLCVASSVVTLIAILVGYRWISRRQQRLLREGERKEAIEAQALSNQSRENDADDEQGSSSSEESEDADGKRLPGDGNPDPIEYCEHIQSEVKKAKNKVVTKETVGQLTEEELQTEREIQRKQLEAIYTLMAEQNEKFGVNSIDQVQEQMKLYA